MLAAADQQPQYTAQHTAQAEAAVLAHAECVATQEQVLAAARAVADMEPPADLDKADQAVAAEKQASLIVTHTVTVGHAAEHTVEAAEAAAHQQAVAGAVLALFELSGATTDVGLAVKHTTYKPN